METLKPYQEEGVKWLAERKYGLLADQMRLGKTPQAIRAADAINALPILVLCPAVARTNWSREFAKFSLRTLNMSVLLEGRPLKELLTADVVICSYDLIQRTAIRSIFGQRKWGLLILDEAHYLKNPINAARTKFILGKKSSRGLVHNADILWALTGTPAVNDASELWIWLYLLGRTKLSYDSFIRKFCEGFAGPYGFQITGTKNIDELRALLAPIMLRRTRKEVKPEIADPQYSDIVVEPGQLDIGDLEIAFPQYIGDPGYKGFYKDMAAETAKLEYGLGTRGSSEEMFALLASQIPHTATLRRYVGLLKVPPILELVRDELQNGLGKIVLFAQHKAVIEKLRDGLSDFGAVTLYGKTPDDKRNRNIDSFQNNPKCRVFIGNLQACAVNIPLHAADDAIFVEADWVPANNVQAAMRIDGYDKVSPIFIRFAGLAGSIDEHIARTLRRKTDDLAKIFAPAGSLFPT